MCYINKNYEEALRHFTDAIQKFPECGASGSVRVAAAACCFKLEQYRRAHDACDAAIYCEVFNFHYFIPICSI